MKNPELFNEANQATYCPEDDKLRLYVGRVPRPEYEALRREGWTSTPKQSEAGQGEFAAVWTESREDTALSYAGFIGDEDAGPAERAAARAERFAGYREARREDAGFYADRYDGQPIAHGFQDSQRAERAAARHDRQADHACNNWEKAEYWTSRTAGVISNALHRATPGVRMGRIKILEAEIRKAEKDAKEYTEKQQTKWDIWAGVAGIREKLLLPYGWQYTAHRLNMKEPTREQLKVIAASCAAEGDRDTQKAIEAGTLAPEAAAAAFLAENPTRPAEFVACGRWFDHAKLRLAYESQMLEAEGGRAGAVDMEPGGWLGGRQIVKVNKSNTSGRVVSVTVRAKTTARYDRHGKPYDENNPAPIVSVMIKTERLSKEVYRAPTDEERAAFAEQMKAEKKERKENKTPCPLINPTPEDAQRLQDVWNAEFLKRCGGWFTNPQPAKVCELTQEQYTARSGGTYGTYQARNIGPDGIETYEQYCGNVERGAAFKVRSCYGENTARRVITLTDKPQKPLPAFVAKEETKPETVNA